LKETSKEQVISWANDKEIPSTLLIHHLLTIFLPPQTENLSSWGAGALFC
jgi:hypothetical protein